MIKELFFLLLRKKNLNRLCLYFCFIVLCMPACSLEKSKLSLDDVRNILNTTREFKNKNLSGLNLSDFNLSKSDFSNAILVNAIFLNANMNDVNLENANLYRADFTKATLKNAELNGAIL